jgi:hypothetical protein
MDRQSEPTPEEVDSEAQIEEQAQQSRKALDQVPPPGTDPLHEGP